MTYLIFCGDRHWEDEGLITQVMQSIFINIPDLTIIEGEAPGADKISRIVAEQVVGVPVIPVPAEWEKHGRAAGPIRNSVMLNYYHADGVVAFHHDILKSKGTKDMVNQATKAGRPVWISSMGPEKLAEFIVKLKGAKR